MTNQGWRPAEAMVRLLLRILALNLIVLGLIIGAVITGRASPEKPESRLPGMDFCQGRACFRGITPGVTSWLDVPAMLNGDVRRRWRTEIIAEVGENDYYVIADQEELYAARVLLVHISPQRLHALPALGHFIEQFGAPCGISPVTEASVKIYFPFMEVGVTTRNYNLSMDSVVYSVTIVNPDTSRSVRRICKEDDGVYDWRGFTSLGRYWRHWDQE